ncbi:MAG TPA: DUF433 domain-containing protein [Thermoanaerobaculia bacterium]|nr:DUF433 domain-containing protein [Thermoanaerobaculia bacterium]
MSAQVLPIEIVVSDPEIRSGQPVIAGTTIRVSDLAAYHTLAGMTADQLAAQFDLDLAQVHAALSYYYRHKVALDAEIRANSDQAELWRKRLVEQGRCTTG